MRILLCVVAVAVAAGARAFDPQLTYDHQSQTYHASKQPVSVSSGQFTITPYFSPDTSINVETQLIESATTSVEVGIPGFDSWSHCGCYLNNSGAARAAAAMYGGAYPDQGCTVEQQRNNESFPIFGALLNAINRGLKVTILTNFYDTHCGAGMIDGLSFLKLAGADVRYYTTTTFLHTKYIQVDGKKASVSSVNFSQTSFMKNREAGVVFEGPSAATLLAFLHATWSSDFNQAKEWPTQTYTAKQMAVIQDKTPLKVAIPPPISFPGAYVTSLSPVTGTMDVEIIDSPDFAWATISKAFGSVQNMFHLFIYQVTNDEFCNQIIKFANQQGVDFKVLVSERIFSEPDYYTAKACYKKMYDAGVPNFRKTASGMYTFSHQKFWILDDTLYMSTGNWGDTDYPVGSMTFPPYGSAGWRNANRDYTIKIKNAAVVAQFKNVLDQDYLLGEDWSPY